MNNNEELELIVRICGDSVYITDDDFQKGIYSINFDKAFDLKSNKTFQMNEEVYYYIRYDKNLKIKDKNPTPLLNLLFPTIKKTIEFKNQRMYKVKLKYNSEMKDVNREVYQLIEYLGEGNDPRLDYNREFEENYNEYEQTLLVYITDDKFYAGKNCIEGNISFTGSLNLENDYVNDKKGLLTWNSTNNDYTFEKNKVYKVIVRKNKQRDDQYMLVEKVGRASDKRLNSIIKENGQEVIIKNDMGEFILDKQSNYIEGTIKYNNDTIDVLIVVKEDDTEASHQMKRLESIYIDLDRIINNAKDFVTKESSIIMKEWEPEDVIPIDTLFKELNKISIRIDFDGEVYMYFNSIDSLGGQDIEVVLKDDNSFEDMDMVG